MTDSSEKNPQKPSNSLIGWLVTYVGNDRGSYYELRGGRSFISSGIIQGERLMNLDAKEVGVAHALLNASTEHQVMLQDLFSSNGTFVTRSGSGDETAVSGPTELGHGDWVRFGENVKFQLCLIHGNSK